MRPRPYLTGALGALLSLGLHGGMALVLAGLPLPLLKELRDKAQYFVAIDPIAEPVGADGATALGQSPTDADRAIPGGAESAQNIDAEDRGQGGDATGAVDGILLMHRDQQIVLFDSPLNNVAAAQTQRIRTARDRATV